METGARSERPSRILVAGGGTGGHVFPALAVAHELAAAGARVEFVGTRHGYEAERVPRAGFRLHTLPVRGLVGKSLVARLHGMALLPVSLVRALRLMTDLEPDAVLGVGGYASAPALVAARLRAVPSAIHEQNAIPGLTNRLLARLAQTVAVSFEETMDAFPGRVVVTGNPVRQEFLDIPAARTPGTVRLLVFGGSQGSTVLNRAMTEALGRLGDTGIAITHQTGIRDLPWVQEAYARSPFPSARVLAFIDDMAAATAEADLVVSRAGATTVAELAAAGRASLLVPFAFAAGDHQEANAEALRAAGAAEILLQRDLGGELLARRVKSLVAEPRRLEAMGARARRLARPHAAREVARIVLSLASPG